MFAVLIGLVLAMLFGLGVTLVYGTDEVMHLPWADQVFWALIGTGALISMIQPPLRCLPCKICCWISKRTWTRQLCASSDCAES